jgi:hypothetical protein
VLTAHVPLGPRLQQVRGKDWRSDAIPKTQNDLSSTFTSYWIVATGRALRAGDGVSTSRSGTRMPGMGIIHGLAISRQHVALLAPSSSGARSHPCDRRTDNALKVRFSATLGQEPEIEVALD